MKIALVQPELSEKYHNQNQAYGSGTRPPETGLAVLERRITEVSNGDYEFIILDPRKTLDELVQQAANYDWLGITDWFSNHDNVVSLADRAKVINPSIKVVAGGPNVRCVGKETLTNHSSIDYAVVGDGEQAFYEILSGRPLVDINGAIPSTYFRNHLGNVVSNWPDSVSLEDMPLWDFERFENADERLVDYLLAQGQGEDPWLVPPITLFSFRGCTKAMREGLCSYCTSADIVGSALSAERFWDQVLHLKGLYGAKTFYMADDIFTISSGRIKQLADAKPEMSPVSIRAYSYFPDLVKLSQPKLEEMAQDLQKIGVFNLFFGSENNDESVLERANKKGISIEEATRIMKTLNEYGGVKTTIAYMLGLPGESAESLRSNIDSFRKLLNIDDCIERLYVSVAMPIKGTSWERGLEEDIRVLEEYEKASEKDLRNDDSPDYELLERLSIKYNTSVTPEQVNSAVKEMMDIAKTKMPAYRVGGFMLGV